MKFRIVLCAIILLITPVFAFAGEKEQLAEELLILTQVDRISAQIQSQLLKDLDRSMRQFNIPEQQKAKALEVHSKINKVILNELSWDKMRDDYVKLFAEVYSTEELRDLVKFHKSPVGQMMIKKQPILVRQSMMLSQKRMDGLIPKLEKMLDEFQKTL